MQQTQCPTCHRVGGEEIFGTCGSHITCARRLIPVDPSKDAVIACDRCHYVRAIPAHAIMTSKPTRTDTVCERSSEHCEAHIVHAKVKGKSTRVHKEVSDELTGDAD